ncbi:hypothetical protein ACQJBY_037873 [Aegilops geniculata]
MRPPVLLSLVILLVICLAWATTTQCEGMVMEVDNGGKEKEKISLPYGLCVHKKTVDPCYYHQLCYCCDLTNVCHATLDECKQDCK